MSMSAHYQDQIDRREDRIASENRIEALEQMLCQCLDYFDDRADVVDGSYGEPSPNREMTIAGEIKEVLGPCGLRDGAIYAAVSRTSSPQQQQDDIDYALGLTGALIDELPEREAIARIIDGNDYWTSLTKTDAILDAIASHGSQKR